MSALPRNIWLAGQPVSRRQLRRLSRQLSAVGVAVPAHRLRQIAQGDSATARESVNMAFADLATHIRREERHAKLSRAQRHCLHWVIVAVAVVVALNVLLCLGLLFFSLATHRLPF